MIVDEKKEAGLYQRLGDTKNGLGQDLLGGLMVKYLQ